MITNVERYVFVSPHLDDAVFSCGGLITRQVSEGAAVTVLTVCAGDPPPGEVSPFAASLHARWGESRAPVGSRRAEDRIACGRLGASVIQLGLPDAIYRIDPQGKPMYAEEKSIFGALAPSDQSTIEIAKDLLLPYCSSDQRLYCPVGYGGHVDHRLTRLAAERTGTPIWYYMDMPYVARGDAIPSDLGAPSGKRLTQSLAEEEIEAWAVASFEYTSQRSTFWSSYEELLQEIRDYHDMHQGIPIVSPA